MHLNPRLVMVVLAGLCVAGIATGTAAAATPKIPKIPTLPKTKVARVEIDLAGYIETKKLTDTTSDCFPGVTYTQTNRYEFETGGYVRNTITNISLPGTDGVITSPFSKTVGSATVEGLLSGYRLTNYCPPLAPAAAPATPKCKKLSGKIAVALTPGGGPSTSGGLVGLGGKRLMLTIARRGSGTEDLTCAGAGTQRVNGVDGKISVVSTSFSPAATVIVTSGLTAIKVFNMTSRDRFRKTIMVEGLCSNVNVTALPPTKRAPRDGALNADGDCWATGKIVLSVRRA